MPKATHGLLSGMNDLGSFGGRSSAFAINDSGQVAGSTETGSAGSPPYHAVVWHDRVMNDLGTLPDGGQLSQARGINDAGQIVGSADIRSVGSNQPCRSALVP